MLLGDQLREVRALLEESLIYYDFQYFVPRPLVSLSRIMVPVCAVLLNYQDQRGVHKVPEVNLAGSSGWQPGPGIWP